MLYASTDPTRSSPFFPAFTKAFGEEQANQIYFITDTIPSGIKDIEEATQTYDTEEGTLVSRVKVAALQGLSSSLMTTRSAITVSDNSNGGCATVEIKVETTKPEKSTLESLLPGFLKDVVQSVPPFPSGSWLESVKSGSSKVVFDEVYCDDKLRVSRYANELAEYGSEVFVWKRKSFAADNDANVIDL